MGYRRNYTYQTDDPERRVQIVVAWTLVWVCFGWFPSTIIASWFLGQQDAWLTIYITGVFAIPILGITYIRAAPVQDQGSPSEMAADPKLNTQDYQLHYNRLLEFGYSNYNGETEFMGPRGGIYTITASGNRNYR